MPPPRDLRDYPMFFWDLAMNVEDWDRGKETRRDEYVVPTPEGWSGASIRGAVTSFRKLLRGSLNARWQELGEKLMNFSVRAGAPGNPNCLVLVRKGPKWGMDSVLGTSPEKMEELRLLRAGLIGADLKQVARAGQGDEMFRRLARISAAGEGSVLDGLELGDEAGKNLGFE